MKRFFAMLLCMTLLLTGVAVAEGEFPELNEAGFFDGGEFVYTDPENGVWRYCSDTLKIEIYRRTQDSPKEIWYEAEVWSTEDNAFAMIPWNEDPDKRMSDLNYPYKIARANQRSWPSTATLRTCASVRTAGRVSCCGTEKSFPKKPLGTIRAPSPTWITWPCMPTATWRFIIPMKRPPRNTRKWALWMCWPLARCWSGTVS